MRDIEWFKKSLRGLDSQLAPDKDWESTLRMRLLETVRLSKPSNEQRIVSGSDEKFLDFGFVLRFWQGSRLLFRPMVAAVAAFVLVFSGSIATASAARASLPGDTLYPVKIGLEKAQIKLASSPRKKAELEIAFAGKRMAEIKQIIAKEGKGAPTTIATVAHINQAINRFNENINGVQKRLEEARLDAGENGNAVGISKLVNNTAGEFENNLTEIKDKIEAAPGSGPATATDVSGVGTSTPALSSLNKAQELLEEASVKSLDMIVSRAASSGDSALKQEAKALLQTKVEQIEKKIEASWRAVASTTADMLKEAVSEVQKKPAQAQKTLEEARKILESKNTVVAPSQLNEVLSKVKESKAIVMDIDKTVKDMQGLTK